MKLAHLLQWVYIIPICSCSVACCWFYHAVLGCSVVQLFMVAGGSLVQCLVVNWFSFPVVVHVHIQLDCMVRLKVWQWRPSYNVASHGLLGWSPCWFMVEVVAQEILSHPHEPGVEGHNAAHYLITSHGFPNEALA